MRSPFKTVLAVGVAVLLVGPALAQFRGGPLVTNKSVQEELKLSKEQVEKAASAVEKVRGDNKELQGKLRDPNLSQQERADLTRQINEAYNKPLVDILNKEQMTRYRQIQLQQGGVEVFNNPDIQKALKLSDDQKGKLKDINETFQKERRELFQGGFSEETVKKMQTLSKDAMGKAAKVLNADQSKTWEPMIGKPFEIKFERPPNQ